MVSQPSVAPFSVLFYESFFENLLKSREQLLLQKQEEGSWRIAILKDKVSQTLPQWQEIVTKVLTLFQEAQKEGAKLFAHLTITTIQSSFVDVTLAANMQTLYRFICSSNHVSSEEEEVRKEDSHKRRLSQAVPVPTKIRRLEEPSSTDEKTITLEFLHTLIHEMRICAFTKTFLDPQPETKLRVFHRRDYLECFPADFTFIIREGERLKKIEAHRSILCFYEYWVKVFLSNTMLEANRHEIIIEEADPEVFEILIDSLYVGRLACPSYECNQPLHLLERTYANDGLIYQQLADLAARYQLPHLVKQCYEMLEKLHQCLNLWYQQKRQRLLPALAPSPVAVEKCVAERETVEDLFKKQLSPYLKLVNCKPSHAWRYGEEIKVLTQVRVQDCSFDESISASSRKQCGGFFDEIVVENSMSGKAIFYGNKVLLMRNLYFRNLIFRPEDRPLPPENVLQVLASSVIAAPKIDWHIESFHPLNEPLSFVRQEIFVFIQEALKEQGDKREALLAQLAQFVAPMEFPRLWLDHFINYFDKHKIDRVEALTQLLKHFGHFISCCILNDDKDISHIMQALTLYCPNMQELQCYKISNFPLDLILASFKKLQSLVCHDCALKASNLLKPLPPSSTLRKLNLTDCSISENASTVLSSYVSEVSILNIEEDKNKIFFFSFFKSIKKLEVCTLFKLREKTLKELIELEMDWSHLKSTTDNLTSSYKNYENNEGWKCSDQTLLLLLARSPLLRILHLTFNYPLKEETILTLIDRHPELIEIELSFINSMSDQILKRLGEKSKKLVFFGCCRDKLSLEAFENMFSNLPLLREVHANFTDEESKHLKAKYPSIKFQ